MKSFYNVVLGLDSKHFMFLKSAKVINYANPYKSDPLHLMEGFACSSLYLILSPHAASEPSVIVGAVNLTLKLTV